jgi:hypothetical protein
MRRLLFGLLAVLTISAPTALSVAPAQAATETTPVITKFNQNLDTFYPRIRDGFRDSVVFSGDAKNLWDEFDNKIPQTWDITIRNADGRTVAKHDGTVRTYYNFRWTWNTKNQFSGTPVQTGRYRATLTVTNDETGETDVTSTVLHATTDTVNRRLTKSRTGTDTSARSHRGSCYLNNFFGSLDIDCWGGREGVARYGFTLPRNARNVTWGMAGSRGCCSNGRVIKTGNRPSATHFDVRIKVTNWAAYTVDRARVTYTTAVRR